MLKVIFINIFPLYSRKIEQYEPGHKDFFLFGMGRFMAEEFIEKDYPASFENWRMDLRISSIMEEEFDGIKCRIFPSKKYKMLGEFSYLLFKELKKISGDKKLIIHFMGVHSFAYHLFAFAAKNRNLISTHLGGPHPLYKFQEMNNKISILAYLLERYLLLKPYNHFVSLSETEVSYFKKLKKSVLHFPIFGIPNVHILEIRDPNECRDKLNLPLDKKIILQVGRATKERGFDWIIEILKDEKFTNKYKFVFAGIHEEDEYYKELKELNQFIVGYLRTEELVYYYNSADLLIYLPNGKMDLLFAGTSYVPVEALACGTPVVATTFVSFPGTEVAEVSRIPKVKADVIPQIKDILSKNISRKRCREIALQYFSWENVLAMYWELYNRKN